MADEETQGQEDTSWWAAQAPVEPSPPSAPSLGFDEPLVWPELPAWDGPVAGAGAPELSLPELHADLDGGLDFLPAPDPPADLDIDSLPEFPERGEPVAADSTAGVSQPAGIDDPDATTVNPYDPLGGLGGGAGLSAPPASPAAPGRTELPESIWSVAAGAGDALLVTSTPAGPTVYAETDGGLGSRRRRSGARGGNVAIIALISLASLVLLGMFLSVRQNDEVVPTDVSQQRPPTDEIAVTGTLNTVPFSPTTSPPSTIDIAGLVPATPTTDTSSPPATTATTRTTVAATQPTTATTAAPVPTTTATTKPDDTQTSTTIRRTTTSFVFPFPTTTVPSNTPTSRLFPTFPSP